MCTIVLSVEMRGVYLSKLHACQWRAQDWLVIPRAESAEPSRTVTTVASCGPQKHPENYSVTFYKALPGW